MMKAHEFEAEMIKQYDEAQSRHLMRFFKTAPGEYGEGDCFLGVRNPEIRRLVKEYAPSMSLADVEYLTVSKWHEVRVGGFLILVYLYSKQAACERRKRMTKRRQAEMCESGLTARDYVDAYLMMLDRGNNWDLVDLVAPKILGDRLTDHPEERGVLRELARMEGKLWHQRVAMVSTWTLIRSGSYDEALELAEHFLTHRHDLIHKASGWMLREVGKRGGMPLLLQFLDAHATAMPRTMLRYAIEQLPEPQRQHYLHLR